MPVQKSVKRPLTAARRTIQPSEQSERTFRHPHRTRRVDKIINGHKHRKEHCDRRFFIRTGNAQNRIFGKRLQLTARYGQPGHANNQQKIKDNHHDGRNNADPTPFTRIGSSLHGLVVFPGHPKSIHLRGLDDSHDAERQTAQDSGQNSPYQIVIRLLQICFHRYCCF